MRRGLHLRRAREFRRRYGDCKDCGVIKNVGPERETIYILGQKTWERVLEQARWNAVQSLDV
jgi:hypothetical protein